LKKISLNKSSQDDVFFMQRAIAVAKRAAALNEVPIAALIVMNKKIIASAYNRREQSNDATAHAELLAIRKACKRLGDWRLEGADLFITMEPCLMCYGAAVQSRMERVVYGCENKKNPQFLRTVYEKWPKGPKLVGGIEESTAVALLSDFFSKLRS
jgi:tRNA(adenine34) deaminase